MAGREALSKEPVQSMEPPTVWTLGNPPMTEREVSLAMRNVPPTSVSSGKEVLVKLVQLTKERELPTVVKFGAEMVVSDESKNPKLLVTFARPSKLMPAMLRNDAF